MPHLLKNQTNPIVLCATGYAPQPFRQDGKVEIDGKRLQQQQKLVDYWRKVKAQDEIDQYSHDYSLNRFRSQWECSADKKGLYSRARWEMDKVLKMNEQLLDERKNRLRALIRKEQEELSRELHQKRTVTTEVKHAAMVRRYNEILLSKEIERQKIVAAKREQHFRMNCDELRALLSKKIAEIVAAEGTALNERRNQTEAMQDLEDRMYDAAWLRDAEAKDELELEKQRITKERNLEFGRGVREQMREVMVHSDGSREHEARLMEEQRRLMDLEMEWEHAQEVLKKERTKQGLNECMREKMLRKSKEAQENLMLDLYYLEKITTGCDNPDEEREKKNLAKKQQDDYLDYLRRQIKHEAEQEAELERLYREASDQMWQKLEKEREADKRKRLIMNKITMEECRKLAQSSSARCRQIEQMKIQTDAEILRDVEAFNAEIRAQDAEIRKINVENQRLLLEQMKDDRRRAEEVKRNREMEGQAIREGQDAYERKVQEALADPKLQNLHPYRRKCFGFK